MKPTFFPTPADFRRWLEEHHTTAAELLVGYYKKGSGRPSMTWSESVDEALCFGWIDGVRRSIDAERYSIRFTPRRRGSVWSAVNIRKVAELTAQGRMRPAGLRVFAERDPGNEAGYSFSQDRMPRLDREAAARFRANAAAWKYFRAQPPGYRKAALWWVVSAKREATRRRRLDTLIEDSAAGRRIALLRREA